MSSDYHTKIRRYWVYCILDDIMVHIAILGGR